MNIDKFCPASVLIVDDFEANRNIMQQLILSLGHKSLLAENGVAALSKMRGEHLPDLVLLDILMPEMDGYSVLIHMKQDTRLRHIPVIVVSAIDEMESIVDCIKLGADDYLVKPFNRLLLKARIASCLERKNLRDLEQQQCRQIEDYSHRLEILVREQVTKITAAQQSTIFAMARLAESRDPETGEHLQRMAEYCRLLSEKIICLPQYAGLGQAFVDNMYAASPLHDIGKVGIPDKILQKPGKLTEEEFFIMKQHPLIGARTLREVYYQHPDNDFIRVGIEIAENHHERWDGSGYPKKLKGDAIPLPGRILALGDVYDALTSKRCYKEAFSHDDSRDYILRERGKHFDPLIVDIFMECETEFLAVRQHYSDLA